jgi:hypothetical protein
MQEDLNQLHDQMPYTWQEKWHFRFSKYLPSFFLIFFLVGCATPAPVKQAIKNQSEGYNELQQACMVFYRSFLRS